MSVFLIVRYSERVYIVSMVKGRYKLIFRFIESSLNRENLKRICSSEFKGPDIYTILRLKGCGSVGCPPPIIFEPLKLPQQVIYRRKGNLSESPNHLKYWENILISRFYEQFPRSSRNLGHFGSSKIFQTLRHKHIIYHFQVGDLEIPNI